MMCLLWMEYSAVHHQHDHWRHLAIMKLFVLTAIIAAVAASPLLEEQKWPWQVGKVYSYDVYSYTLTKFDQGISNGNSFRAQFVIRVKSPGKLVVKLVEPLYAPIKAPIFGQDIPLKLPSDLKYEPIKDLAQTFEITVDGGRVVSFNVPSSLRTHQENLLKGLISALQVDVSTFGHFDDYPNSFDKESFQGQFKKWETDVTGNCATLYTVSPTSAEWRREFPEFTSEQDPIEIIKSRSYDSCQNATGQRKDFIDYNSEARFVTGKQGTIYKSQVLSSVLASPLLTGKQKTEVVSYVEFYLKSVQQDDGTEWQKAKEYRSIDSLLFKIDKTLAPYTYAGEHNVAKAQKILQEITPLLQDPNRLSKEDFLLKFQVLTLILRSLNSEQFNQMTSSIEIAKTSKNIAKNGMWIIYRDAVAETGTVEAFQQIKSWVLSNNIEGEEAAQLISAIGASLSRPSKKLLVDFFNFVKSPEVVEQVSVSNSALLAFTKLLRDAGQDQFVVETVIPYLSKQLKLAVENGDNSKPQVYVRVLGNLAYPEILQVFAPYLEGKVAVNKYLRIQMVTSLKKIADLKDPYVRVVLYSILRNTAEPYEIRVAAALNIFLSFPSAEMFQVMAHMTNNDPSTQVRAVLASGITFAAGLKEPQFAELAQSATAMLGRITKYKYGYRYSTDSLIDGYTSKDDFSFFNELAFIGSEDHILPKYYRSSLRFKETGYDDARQLILSVSDVQDFISYFYTKFFKPIKAETNFKFSAKQLAEALNIKRAPRQPLEGALFSEYFNQQRLFTFNEKELTEVFIDSINYFEKNFGSPGIGINYTKILTAEKETIILPLVSGVPFRLKYSRPIVITAQLQSKVIYDENITYTEYIKRSIESKIDITVARNLEGSVGYVDTIKEVLIDTGVVNKVQWRLPAKIITSYNKAGDVDLKFEQLQNEKDINLVHYSVWPYTGIQKKDLQCETEVIRGSEKTFRINQTFGYLTNQLIGYSYSSDFKKFDLFENDIFTTIGNIFYQKDIALTELDLTYLSKESTAKSVTFSLYTDELYNQNNDGELGRAALPQNSDANSTERRAELIKKVSSGIKSAQVKIIEISAKFDAVKKIEYSLATAIAYSFVDPKFQAGFFAHGTENKYSAVFQINKQDTKIVPFNFEEALKNKINVTYDFDIISQQNISVRVQGYGMRSDDYTQRLLYDPLARNCLQDVSKNYLDQADCQKLIIKAHAPDLFKFTVQFENFDSLAWTYLTSAYTLLAKQYLEEEYSTLNRQTENENTTLIEAQAYYYDKYIRFQLISKYGFFIVKREGLTYHPYTMAVYGPLTSYERTLNWFTGYQAWPYCAVDDSKVKTFSGRSYDYTLTGSWHVVMLDEADNSTSWNDLVILARRPSANQVELYIFYKTDDGKYIEVEIKPNNVEVKTNGIKTIKGPLTMYFDEDEKVPLFEYYTLAKGIQVFNIRDDNIRILYDNQRLIIFTDEHRSTTNGICGQSSGQVGDDYLTQWGLVDLPELYGASFSLDGEFSDPKTAELKNQTKLKAYQPVTKYTKILYSDADWSKVLNKSFKRF